MSLSFVRGQESLFEELDIAIWPEYDKPGVLVFMEGTIRQDALPTTLEFRVPEEVGAVGALFSDDSDKVPFEVPVVQREDGKWAILGIPRGQQILRTGYYYDPFISQVERAINYLLEFNKSLDDFNVQIQEPLAAENFWIEDSTTQMSKDTTTGLNSCSLHLERLAAGKQKLISFGYLNPSGQLSIEVLQQPISVETADQELSSSEQSVLEYVHQMDELTLRLAQEQDKLENMIKSSFSITEQDQFETDVEYRERIFSQMAENYSKLKTEYNDLYGQSVHPIEQKIVAIEDTTFETSDIKVTLKRYDANRSIYPMTVKNLNFEGEVYEVEAAVDREQARSLYNNWEEVEKTGLLRINREGTILLWSYRLINLEDGYEHVETFYEFQKEEKSYLPNPDFTFSIPFYTLGENETVKYNEYSLSILINDGLHAIQVLRDGRIYNIVNGQEFGPYGWAEMPMWSNGMTKWMFKAKTGSEWSNVDEVVIGDMTGAVSYDYQQSRRMMSAYEWDVNLINTKVHVICNDGQKLDLYYIQPRFTGRCNCEDCSDEKIEDFYTVSFSDGRQIYIPLEITLNYRILGPTPSKTNNMWAIDWRTDSYYYENYALLSDGQSWITFGPDAFNVGFIEVDGEDFYCYATLNDRTITLNFPLILVPEEVEDIAAKKAAADKAATEKAAAKAAEEAAEEARLAEEAAAEQDLACQEKYNLSQEKYRDGKYEETVTTLEELLQMEGCDEELSARAQYYIGWNYGNKQFKLDAAKEAYQKVIDNYAGSKYVAMAEEKLKALQDFIEWDAPPPPPSSGPNVKFIAYDDPPIPIGGYGAIQKNIIYPEIAQEAGIEGKVIIQAFIDKKGRVQGMSVLQGIPNTGLNEAAMVAIKKTRFKPAQQRDRPVGVYISIPVNFKLKG